MESEKLEVDLRNYPFTTNGIAIVSLAKRSFEGVKVSVHNSKSSWVPLFTYLGIEVLSIIEDGTFCDKLDIINHCKQLNKMQLRLLTETAANISSQTSDFLYQVDYKGNKPKGYDNGMLECGGKIPITSWQSYGRSYIIELDEEIAKFKTIKSKALILPCRGNKPYNHDYLNLPKLGDKEYHKVVISSIGVIPEEFWLHSVIMGYATGVPDIFRVYQLTKNYLKNNPYKEILCYLDYTPYIEILEILQKTNNLNIKFFNEKQYKKQGPKFTRDFEIGE